MKTTIITLTCALLCCMNLLAQDAERRDAKFEYIQLPARPLDPSVKNYNSTITASFEQRNKEKKENYEQEVKNAETEYTNALDVYNKKSVGTKILDKTMLDQGKPVKRNVPVPVYEKSFNLVLLNDTYIKIEGFNKAQDNALSIGIDLLGFEMKDPVVVSENVYQSGQTIKKYKYEIEYRHQMAVKVTAPGQGEIYNQIPEALAEYKKTYTATFNSESELKGNYEKTKSTFISTLEDKAVNENLKTVNEMLNSDYAFRKIKHATDIWVAEGKKFDYTDYTKAFEMAMNAYNTIGANLDKTVPKTSLGEAVKIWETAFNEADLKDKKARINREVAGATLLNIAEAYMWMDQFEQARIALTKLNGMDMKAREKRHAEAITKKMEDLEARHNNYYKK